VKYFQKKIITTFVKVGHRVYVVPLKRCITPLSQKTKYETD
jgi:hypothetical protein